MKLGASARTAWRDIGIVSVVLFGFALAAAPARAQAGPPRELPPDEVLRLMEEAAHHLESIGKSSLAAGRESPFVVAAESLHAYDAIHYDLDVVPSRTSFHVDGRMTLTLVVRSAGLTHVDLDALEMTFSSVKVNGVARTGWTWSAGKLLVPVCEGPSCPPHAPGDTLVVEVTYAANPSMGFYSYPRNTYTSVEPDLARRWWPCYDQPFDKATLDLRATVPTTESCWSNGALTADHNQRYPLYNPPPGQTFGTTIYKKGESVLHMLRRIVGDAAFFAGLQLYGTRFAYGNATTRDFQEAMEDAWGQPLDWFFDPWVFEAGIPTYAWTWQVASPDPPQAGHVDLGLHVRQVQVNAPFYRMPIEFRITRAALPDTVVAVWNEAVEEQAFAVRIRGTVTGVVFDPRASILKRIQPGVVDAGAPIATFEPGLGSVALAVSPNPASGAVALRGTWHPGISAGAGPGPEVARFTVYDATGRLVRDLGDVSRPAGAPFVVSWDRTDQAGRRVVPGLYFVRITAAGKHEARPVVLVP